MRIHICYVTNTDSYEAWFISSTRPEHVARFKGYGSTQGEAVANLLFNHGVGEVEFVTSSRTEI